MKFLGLIVISLFLASTGKAADAPNLSQLDNNAYVRLYTEWVELDKNNLERMQVVLKNETARYERALKLVEKGNMSQQDFDSQETRFKLSQLNILRQEAKIRESEARLSVVKGRVGAGLTDIPICSRPSDTLFGD